MQSKKQNMLGMVAMMAAMFNPDNYVTFKQPKKVKKKPIPKGLKEFFYGENKIYALNQKNADRKARKKGYL